MANEDEAVDVASWYSGLACDQWVSLPVSGQRPLGRYKHAAAVVGEKLYISGGSRNGRHLSDIQVLDLMNSTWSSVKIAPGANTKLENGSLLEAFPATSGHQMVVWAKKLLIFDGASKHATHVTVRFLDLETLESGVMEINGELPVARSGHSVTLVGSKVIMFGGEDAHRRLFNDIHILDLDSMTWDKPEAMQPSPSPRYDHSAAVHAERYLLVFGGCSHSTCFNDLHVLDLHTMSWSQPESRGDYVTARAGHSGASIAGSWFIVGGGDNKRGTPETLVLDMVKLVWSVVSRVDERDPLASEGISICSASIHGNKYLVAFGGYNGKYNNEVFVMKPKLKDSARPKIYQSPAAAAAAASVSAAYSIGSPKQLDLTKIEDSNTDGIQTQYTKRNGFADLDGIKAAKRALESSLAEVTEENSTLRGKIDDINNTHAELSQELDSVQGQLVAERSRCFKLEAQIAELQSMLASLPSLEAEVQSLREEKSTYEEDVSKVDRQGSRGGVWQWFAGGGSSP